MKVAKLAEMHRGWFVGDFNPTVFQTQAAEVGVKHYAAGAQEERHHHKIATEITTILSGQVRMNGQDFFPGDIVTITPNESTDFQAITDAMTVVVKVPGVLDDKFPGEASC